MMDPELQFDDMGRYIDIHDYVWTGEEGDDE